jgi:hypothetical protein
MFIDVLEKYIAAGREQDVLTTAERGDLSCTLTSILSRRERIIVH